LVALADREDEEVSVRQAAAAALTRIRMSVLVTALATDADAEVRAHYAWALGQSWHASDFRDKTVYWELAIPALLRAAREDASADVRNKAVLGLGCLCDTTEAQAAAGRIVPILIEAVGDTDREVRISAVVALGDYGRLAEAALPLLRRMRDDPDDEMSNQVRRGIWCIETHMKEGG